MRDRNIWSQDHQAPTLTTALVTIVLGIAGFIAYNTVAIREDMSAMKEHVATIDARIARLNHKVFPGEFDYDRR